MLVNSVSPHKPILASLYRNPSLCNLWMAPAPENPVNSGLICVGHLSSDWVHKLEVILICWSFEKNGSCLLFLTSKDPFCYVLQISADWERASLRPSSQPSSVFKQSPQDETYITEGGFINTNLVQDEESQEFDDLIFALKTGMSLSPKW